MIGTQFLVFFFFLKKNCWILEGFCTRIPSDIRNINAGNVIYPFELNKYYFSSFTDGKLKVEIKILKLASYFIKCLITSFEQSYSGE